MRSTIFVFFAIFACLAFCSESERPARNCVMPCPAIERPVCGENSSNDQRTFANSCVMDVFNCKNPNNVYRKIKDEACSPQTTESDDAYF